MLILLQLASSLENKQPFLVMNPFNSVLKLKNCQSVYLWFSISTNVLLYIAYCLHR